MRTVEGAKLSRQNYYEFTTGARKWRGDGAEKKVVVVAEFVNC